MIVCVKPGQKSLFQLGEFLLEFPVRHKRLAHLHKRSHNEDAHLDGPVAIENIGRLNCAMLGEGVRQVLDVLTTLQGHNL